MNPVGKALWMIENRFAQAISLSSIIEIGPAEAALAPRPRFTPLPLATTARDRPGEAARR